MIGTSIDRTEFTPILPQERFSVDAPSDSPLIAASSLDLTRTEKGVDFSAIRKNEREEAPSVDRVLRELVGRCKKDLEDHPVSTRMKLNLSLALINAGQFAEAAENLTSLLVIDPLNYAALSSLALLYFNQGEFTKSAELYRQLHSAFPNDPKPLVNLASICLRNQQIIAAAGFLEKAVALDGCEVTAKYLLAMIWIHLCKYTRAIGLLRATLRENGNSAELNQGLAIAYLAAGDFKRADRAFLTCLTINKRMSSAVHGLAFLRLQEHRHNDAVNLLLDHLESEPNDGTSRELLARAYAERGQFTRARNQLLMLVPSETSSDIDVARAARLCNNIGYCLAKEGKGNDAEFWLKRSITLNSIPENAAPYTNLGRVLLGEGKPKEALEIARRAIQMGVATPDIRLLESTLLVELQRFDDAIDVLQSLVESGSAPTQAYSDLGWLLGEWREDYASALSVLTEGAKENPRDPFLLNNLAYVHLMRGEVSFARIVLDQINDDKSNETLLTATRGLLRLWEGAIEDGEDLYRRAEVYAFQAGLREVAISIRQKRFLEVAKAHLRNHDPEKAIKYIRNGIQVLGGKRYYHFHDQLVSMSAALSAGNVEESNVGSEPLEKAP
jgi:Flp pilus assembly protein TadD